MHRLSSVVVMMHGNALFPGVRSWSWRETHYNTRPQYRPMQM